MKTAVLSVVLFTVFCAGCSPSSRSSVTVKKNENVVTLSSNLLPKQFQEDDLYMVAIVDKHGTEGEFRLFAPNEPRFGGVAWEGMPDKMVREHWNRKKKDQSLWVKLHCNLERFSAKYPTQPLIDPWGKVNDRTGISFYFTDKIEFPPNPSIIEP